MNCFQYWDRGVEKMPPMIRYIYNHNLKQSQKYNFKLVLITDENVKEYFKPHQRFFDLASNFKSDIVRYNVLDIYGGIWLDTDIIITKDLNLLYNTEHMAIVDIEDNNDIV
jgi:mannosyltransferase OCH1-like enzyme